MFQHILAPVDGSLNLVEALDKAVALAQQSGAAPSILTIYRHHSMLEASLSMVRPEDPSNMDDIMRGHAKDVAEAAKARAEGVAEVHAYVRNGSVARGIVGFAREHDCDLIVIGGRGMGSVEGFLLGSVSHKVTGMAECPVIVV